MIACRMSQIGTSTVGTNDQGRLAVGDGALGFWKALDELFPGTSPSALLAA